MKNTLFAQARRMEGYCSVDQCNILIDKHQHVLAYVGWIYSEKTLFSTSEKTAFKTLAALPSFVICYCCLVMLPNYLFSTAVVKPFNHQFSNPPNGAKKTYLMKVLYRLIEILYESTCNIFWHEVGVQQVLVNILLLFPCKGNKHAFA